MTTTTDPLARKSRSRPVVTAVVGLALVAAGLILGRIPYPVEARYWSAMQVDSVCRAFDQVTGAPATNPSCAYAHDLLVLAGTLIIAGLAIAATGITVAVLRYRAATAEESARGMESTR